MTPPRRFLYKENIPLEVVTITASFRRLYGYARGCRRRYIAGGICLLFTNAFAIVIPWLMKLAVESLQHPSPQHPPGRYALLIVAAALLHGGIRIFSRTEILHAGRTIEFRIREDLYARLVSLDSFDPAVGRTGDILSRFSNDLTNVRMLLGFGLMNVVNTVLIYLSAIAFMVRINPLLTLLSVAPFPLMIFLVKKVSARIFRRSLAVQEELATLTARVEENVSAAAVVRGYCMEERETQAFGVGCDRYRRESLALARLRGLILPIMATATGTGTLIVLFVGGKLAIAGAITLGDFVAFSGYLTMLAWPTVMIGWILNLMQRGAASMTRLLEILEAQPRVADAPGAVGIGQLSGSITFRGLTFAYGDQPVLQEIDLEIPAGARVGVVGKLGSGKSTLVRLIPRLLPVPQGALLLDGLDVNDIRLDDLRRGVAFVPQEAFLFSRSIRDNIAFGGDAAGVEEAARLARLHDDVVAFPQGYDTVVGERGITLSGGQRQRTALARALLRNPRVLLLDDPLSAVDAATEEAILEGLFRYFDGRTVVLVSHRLFPLRNFDLIVVLDEGRVAERGTHVELVEAGGIYARMWHEQRLRRELDVA